MPAYVPGVTLIDQLYMVGTKFKADVRASILEAKMSASIGQVTQIDLSIMDPGFKLLGSGMIADGMRGDLAGYAFTVASVATQDKDGTEVLDVKLRPYIVRLLQERQGILVMSNVSPTEFIASECAAVGAQFVGQPSQQRNQVSRDVLLQNIEGQRPVSSWTTFNRLAGELGYVIFESKNVIYFGKPSWIIQNAGAAFDVYYERGVTGIDHTLGIPQCSRSVDDPKGEQIEMLLPIERIDTVGLGKKINLHGVPTFDGLDYLVNSVSCNLLDPGADLSVQAQRPVDPVINNTSFGGGGTPSQYGRHGTKSSQDFVAWLLEQLGDQYVFGAPTQFNNDNPTQFDCSSLVQWGCSQVGVYMPRTTYEQEPYCQQHGYSLTMSAAANIPGAILFTEGHVGVSLGNGRDTIEAMNEQAGVCKGRFTYFSREDKTSSFAFRSAFLIPDMIYPRTVLNAVGLYDESSLYG